VAINIGSASVNNYSPTGYVAGTTNRLFLGPVSGGSTITGLVGSGASDGWQILIVNFSTTNVINFPFESSSSSANNQFFTFQGETFTLQPLSSAVFEYVYGTPNAYWYLISYT
jgi:hypothetical protein